MSAMSYQYEAILQKMSLQEKISLCTGGDFWHTKAFEKYGIPCALLTDGPHGVRRQREGADMLGLNAAQASTCFPTSACTANSWDPALLEQVGAAIGEEAAAAGVGVVLGPGVNLKRSPLCGRNFEYFSEDPLLAGRLGAAWVRGAQRSGTQACVKHFALNNQEYKRFSSDSAADARTMRELYLAPFETVVREGKPAAVMSAYNRINGVHCSDSQWLLEQVLRGEWGFDGLVVTDWGGIHDRTAGFAAGCDLCMPGPAPYGEAEALQAVREGRLPESAVDRCADRVLAMVFRAAESTAAGKKYDADAHHALARRAARESAVLLKNEGGLLPFAPGARLALLGDMAEHFRFQGAGSSHIVPTQLISPRAAFPEAAYAQGCRADDSTDDALLQEAARTAAAADAVLVFAGLPDAAESEGFDRPDMAMPAGHAGLIEAAAAANPNTAVVLLGGSAMELPWADKVRAILYLSLSGQAGAQAAADLVWGRACPGGRLAESWPLQAGDAPCAPYYAGTRRDAQYREGLYVGYRYYASAGVPVRYPFGYGLSYTSFAYSALTVSPGKVTARITNTGTVTGAETAQLYLAPPAGGPYRPVRELRGFARVELAPGESAEVVFPLDRRSFAVWQDGWKVQAGRYGVLIGASSGDIRLSACLAIDGEPLPVPAWQKGSWYGHPCGAPTQAQWEAMLGRRVSESAAGPGHFTIDSTLEEMKDASPILRGVYEQMKQSVLTAMHAADEKDPNFRMAFASSADSALRSLYITSQGAMSWEMCMGLLTAANAPCQQNDQ